MMLSATLSGKVATAAGRSKRSQRSPWQRGAPCRRCSERQSRGEPHVSEWFVSEEQTDWTRIATLYQALALLMPSPVVELNRAVAVAMASGPERGLEIVDGYHHLPSVRGDLLARLGRHDEAAGEFRRAASLTRNIPERTVLLQRAADCAARTQRITPQAGRG